jgi:hypothetical protein
MEEMDKKVPNGVKIISVLYIIFAIAIIFATIFYIYNMAVISKPLDIPADSGLDIPNHFDTISLIMIMSGIIFVGSAVFFFFIGRGLWKGKNWARMTVIVFSVLSVVGGLGKVIDGNIGAIISAGVSAIIGGYLFFNKNVKQVFI